MKILQISTSDSGGGASRIAYHQFKAYQSLGYSAWLAVGSKVTDEPNIFKIPKHHPDDRVWSALWHRLEDTFETRKHQIKGGWRFAKIAANIAEPRHMLERYLGIEDFNFPGTSLLPTLPPEIPDLIHAHNLHGNYFDLRSLPYFSQQYPMVLSLHDAWTLTGHCAHHLGCERWKIGCGQCPDLKIYPAVHRDSTDFNWQRKQQIYAHSRLGVATSSQWLMDQVKQSMLMTAAMDTQVIHTGIDLKLFHDGDRQAARIALNLSQDAYLLLFSGSQLRSSPFKDYDTIHQTMQLLAQQRHDKPVILIVLGDAAPSEHLSPQVEIRFEPFRKDQQEIVQFYQAADLYLHAAKVDTFPNVILESLACGTAVVATAVAGIPEQVKSLQPCENFPSYTDDEATGILVTGGDAEEMANATQYLLKNNTLRQQLHDNAVRDAHQRFDHDHYIQQYLDWYAVIIEKHQKDHAN